MKKKVIIAALATICAVSGVAALTACDNGGSGHTHDYDTTKWVMVSDEMCAHPCKLDGCTSVSGAEPHNTESSTTATCTDGGDKTTECTRCEYSVTEHEDALGHDFSGSFIQTATEHYKLCAHDGCEEKSQQGDHIWQISGSGLSETSIKYVCHTCQKEDIKQVTFADLQSGNNAVAVIHGDDVNTLTYYKYTASVEGIYNLKSDSSEAYVTVIQGGEMRTNGGSGGYNIYMTEGETVYFVFDTQGSVSLEYTAVFAVPGTQSNPIRLNSEDAGTVDITLKAGEKRYYIVVGGYALYASFDEVDASMVVTTTDGTETYTGANGDNIVLDASELGGVGGDREDAPDEESGVPFYFTSERDITFSVVFEEKIDEGSYSKPYELPLNTEMTVSVKIVTTSLAGRPSRHGEELWYAFTPEVSGWYRFYSTDENAAFINARYERYGDEGSGFDYTVYIDKSKYEYTDEEDDNAVKYRPYMCQLTSADGNGAVEAEYTFKVVKVADPTTVTLGTPAQATADDLFFEFVPAVDGEYEFTVSELSAGNYFTVEYPDQGTQKSLTVTGKSVKATIKANVSVYIRLNEACTLTVTKAERDPYALSLGKSDVLETNKDYTFTVPDDGDYSFTITPWATSRGDGTSGNYFKLNAEIFADLQTQTLTDLKAGDKITINMTYSDKNLLILPASAKTISLSAVTSIGNIKKDELQMLYFSGDAETEYGIKVIGENVVLTDATGTPLEKSVITADENGSITVFVKYTGEETASDEIKVAIGIAIGAGAKSLEKSTGYAFIADQDGNYKIEGARVAKSSSAANYFMVNGEKVVVNETSATADVVYTLQAKAGEVYVLFSEAKQANFAINLVTE
ncbi:MAG: hypothetical protein NC033_05110 [Clostridiales bacterium]|nr:hypothetical protein [Clostridiales bacterium]